MQAYILISTLLWHMAICSSHQSGFPSTAFVITVDKALKGISEVQVGDDLFNIDQGGKTARDRVVAMLVQDDAADGLFVQIKLVTGEVLEVKPKQLVSIVGSGGVSDTFLAKDVKPGQMMIALNNALFVQIMQVGVIRRHGVHLPLTESGSIFVNGVMVSCYSLMRSSAVAGMMFKKYNTAINYLPESIKPYTHFMISNKHWMHYLYEWLVNTFHNGK